MPTLRTSLGALLAGAALLPATASAQVKAPDDPPPMPAPAAAPTPEDTTTPLRAGSRGARVKEIQRALELRPDGVYGARTRQAVRRYQQRSGLPATGEVDAATAAALSMRVPAVVRQIQRALKVRASGRLTKGTRAAIRAAEAGAGLHPDGLPDRLLLGRLGIPLPTPVVTVVAVAPAPAAVAGAAWVAAARSRLGAPYGAGAAGPDSFDCSGLVFWALRGAGVGVPRSSFEQFKIGTPVDRTAIQAGDLVFFDTAGPGASDVGIATGPANAISATTRGVVQHTVLSGYWAEHFVGARRL